MWDHLQRIAETLAAIVAILAVTVPWTFRWFSRVNMTYRFSKSLATNHLPHIYKVLRAIAIKQGIEVEDEPLVQFVDTNGNGENNH